MRLRHDDNNHMKKRWILLIPALLSILIAAGSIVISTYEPLWIALGVSDLNFRGSLTMASSVFFLLLGFLVSQYWSDATTLTVVQQKLNELAKSQSFSVCRGDQALDELCGKIGRASRILNTRIGTSPEHYTSAGKLMSKWETSLRKAVRNDVSLTDVFGPEWVALAKERTIALQGSGRYEAFLSTRSGPFINFILLEFLDETREVWFGWHASTSLELSDVCIRCSESNVVSLFTSYYRSLKDESHKVAIP